MSLIPNHDICSKDTFKADMNLAQIRVGHYHFALWKLISISIPFIIS